MKKIYLFIIPLFIYFTFITPKAITSSDVYNTLYMDEEFIYNYSNFVSGLNYLISNKPESLWINNYYFVMSDPNIPTDVYFHFVDKATGSIQIYSLTLTNNNDVMLNFQNWEVYVFTNNSLRITLDNSFAKPIWNVDFNFLSNNSNHLIASNIPIKYISDNGNWIYIQNRIIPNQLWPENHYMKTNDVLDGNQIDSIVDTNLITILDEFDIDLLFQNLESVLEQIYGFIESSFLSLNEVITYITGSLNNIVSFITANITIISIISMVYLALPSILRDLFTFALSTSVVFIMLRRFI